MKIKVWSLIFQEKGKTNKRKKENISEGATQKSNIPSLVFDVIISKTQVYTLKIQSHTVFFTYLSQKNVP